MKKRYFSLDEANAMIPWLESTFIRLLQLRHQVRMTLDRLDDAGFAPGQEDFDIKPDDAPATVILDLANLKGLMGVLSADLSALGERGCIVKGLENGLVDWYAKKDGRDVLLCWRLGESEISHWHDVENGLPERRPIEEFCPTPANLNAD